MTKLSKPAAPIVFGALRRGRPESWTLLRATDLRALAYSDTVGGAVKAANALWPRLDASEAPIPSAKIVRDKAGAVVAIVIASADAAQAKELVKAAHARTAAPTEIPVMPKAKICPPSFDPPETPAPKARKTRSPIVHLVMPDALRAQIEAARDAIEAATTVRPSASDVVRSALAIGIPTIVQRTQA